MESKKTIVIKVGTSSIIDDSFTPNLPLISLLITTCSNLRKQGHKVVIVSSGAVGMGISHLKLTKRPKGLSELQALAAIGQGRLHSLYTQLFQIHGLSVAQVLLTRDNISERSSYLQACSTLRETLRFGAIPIVNENDSVSCMELKFGDNDTLSAVVAGIVDADYLFLLTDVDALYTANPNIDSNAKRIPVVRDMSELNNVNTSGTSSLGTGGMTTKLIAAELCTSRGINMIICSSIDPRIVVNTLNQLTKYDFNYDQYEPSEGTHFVAKKESKLQDRAWWIMHSLSPHGTVQIDAGAFKAIMQTQRNSLLVVGIIDLTGTFNAQQCITLTTLVGGNIIEIGRGIVEYSSLELRKIKGLPSQKIEEVLGYIGSECAIHRYNLIVYPQVIEKFKN